MSDDLDDEPIDQLQGTQILWGRVLVLLLALALSFWLGTTFGGDAGDRTRISDQQERIAELEAQVAELEAQIAAVSPGTIDATAAPAVSDPTPPEPDEAPPPDGESEAVAAGGDTPDATGEEYVVQSGDTLAGIAQDVYGDPSLWRVIAGANNLEPPYALTVGETLDIPEQP